MPAAVVLNAPTSIRVATVSARAIPTAAAAAAPASHVAPIVSASRSTVRAQAQPAKAPSKPVAHETGERVLAAAVISNSTWVTEPAVPAVVAADATEVPAVQPHPLDDVQTQSFSVAPSTASFTLQKDQNSVTIKGDTSVKDAAGAIVKVLDRLCSTIVTALQVEPGHEALNRACKALAVCRKYLTDSQPGLELSFFPVNRSDAWGREDPHLFSFLAFKSHLQPGVKLTSSDQPDLHVSSNSDPTALAHMILKAIQDQGQALMKAGGGCALFVAMTAVIRARHMLKALHSMDILLVPQWITEDTRASLGRESKFLQFTILPAGLHGVRPVGQAAMRSPAVVPVAMDA